MHGLGDSVSVEENAEGNQEDSFSLNLKKIRRTSPIAIRLVGQ